MAGAFGDLDLFSEFEKEREAKGSFIHYDQEEVRSRIIFEDFEDQQESESDEDYFATDESKAETGQHGGEPAENKTSEKSDSESLTIVDSEKDAYTEDGSIKKDTSVNGSTVSTQKSDEQQIQTPEDERAFWLSDQLRFEDAKGTVTNTQQLIYERNKFHRYAKILDSTRYVPDEESPAVQLIFNNNAFARKYRQQIEQFIKGLMWEEFNSSAHEPAQEVNVKSGAPSCIDINTNLPPGKRIERMRQRHAIIGNSQFHKQFLIDFLGWPYQISEPTRCNVNWEIPLYGQVFNEVYADPANKSKKPSKRPKPSCWNCGEENHAVIDCKQPRNPAKIAMSRREFLSQQSQSNFEPKFSGPARYHLDPELSSEFLKFKPGVLSEALRQALGLSADQLPQHIYKMRLYGYPPGWLAVARQIQSGVTIFDKNGRVTLITGECLEDGELDEHGEGAESRAEYDVNKIIEYPGFTVPVPLGFFDEHSSFKMPPIQQHQLKKTLVSQTTDETSSKKRKRGKKGDEKKGAKKMKVIEAEQEDGEVKEEGEVGAEESTGIEEKLEEATEGSTETMEAAATTSPPKHDEVEERQVIVRSSSTISLSRDYGTPVLVREKSGLPDASKFGQGIEEHIPFENLPNSTGIFEKMKGLIDIIRQKSKKQT